MLAPTWARPTRIQRIQAWGERHPVRGAVAEGLVWGACWFAGGLLSLRGWPHALAFAVAIGIVMSAVSWCRRIPATPTRRFAVGSLAGVAGAAMLAAGGDSLGVVLLMPVLGGPFLLVQGRRDDRRRAAR
jgi:hypothetical protein